MSKIYPAIIKTFDKLVPGKLRPLWEHPAGPKTIFFWAPAMKWAIVIAGLGDFSRPPELLSLPQCASLCASGVIMARYATQIIPVNYVMLSVNLVLAILQMRQVIRVVVYQQSLENAESDGKKKTK